MYPQDNFRQKPKTRFFSKKIKKINCLNQFYADVVSLKKLKTYHASIPHSIKKPNFDPILGVFCFKNSKITILSTICQNMFYPIFSKKSDKLDAFICYKTPKTHLGVLFVQKLQCKIFLKKIIWVNCKPLGCCNFK